MIKRVPNRTTINFLRAGLADVLGKLDALDDERIRILQSLADALSPLRVGDRFHARTRERRGVIAFTDMHGVYFAERDEFECIAVHSYGGGTPDPSYWIEARRILKSGGLSKRTFAFRGGKHRFTIISTMEDRKNEG